MGHRYPNPKLVKIHRNYTVEDIARSFDLHKNTVRQWIKRGLPTIDKHRPALVLGRDLAAFLQAQRRKAKQPCLPGFIYCMKCRAPRAPAGDMAEYRPMNATGGNLIGICPDCDKMMYRRVNRARLDAVKGNLDVSFTPAEPRIRERDTPSLNSDSSKDRRPNANT